MCEIKKQLDKYISYVLHWDKLNIGGFVCTKQMIKMLPLHAVPIIYKNYKMHTLSLHVFDSAKSLRVLFECPEDVAGLNIIPIFNFHSVICLHCKKQMYKHDTPCSCINAGATFTSQAFELSHFLITSSNQVNYLSDFFVHFMDFVILNN